MDSSNAATTWTRPVSLWLAPVLLLALGAIVILFDPFGTEAGLSNRLFDAYQRHAARPFDNSHKVRVLELPVLDEDSLVRITRALIQQGAGLIVFTAPIQTGPSPESLAARLPPGSDAARAALERLPEPGHDLAEAIAGTKAIVPVMLGASGRAPQIKAHFVYRGAINPFGEAPLFNAAAAAPALLETNATGVGAANLMPDPDGVVRHMPMALRLGGGLVPGMAAEVLRVADGASDITMTGNEHDPLSFFTGIGLSALETKAGGVPTDAAGRIRLRYAADISPRVLHLETLATEPLKDAIVLIGAAGQVVKTPLGPASIANVMAEGVEDLLTGQVLRRPDWLRPMEALLLLSLGVGLVVLLRFGLGWAAAVVMAGAAGLGLLSWYLYAAHGLLLDAATPALFLLLAFVAGAAAWVRDLRLAYAGLRAAFLESLPRATIEKIARRPNLLKLDGETRTVTYLVCGVRGLAKLAGEHTGDAAGFTRIMQRVLTPLMDQALAHGGTIDRLTADGFAAFWNAPLDDADHALHACEAAHDMAAAAQRIGEELAREHKDAPSLEISMGIATGAVIAGGFGGAGRMGYSVHGAAVNLAQRIQGLAHHYGLALVAADETRKLAERGFAFLEIDTIGIGGASGDAPVTLYAVLGNPASRASPKFRALTVFHDHIFQAMRKQNWAMARELINQCRRLSGASQRLYDLHLTRIAYYEKNPPGAEWDGAFRPVLE
ncbi:MAG TPA: CHASE2 domain-containing protein [Rhizomicrobium sp.]|nr:CHASE2 domain-containing protein [Rhizomicrobium sp.]